MALPPQPGLVRRLAIVLLLAGAVGSAAWGTDHALRAIYERLRPGLQTSLGQSLGHPLELGPYQGLGWDGVRLGPSRLLPGPRDDSSASLRGLSLRPAPLTSLRRRLPVLQLSLRGAELDLRRNAQGQYWVLGSLDPSQSLPRLELQLRLAEPARLRLSPSEQTWRLGGAATVQLQNRGLDLRGQLRPGSAAGPAIQAGGAIDAHLRGRWDRPAWELDLRARSLNLESLGSLLALPGALEGRADGSLRLSLNPAGRACQGEVRTRGLRWRPGSAAQVADLALPDLRLRCRGTQLELPSSRWRWGRQQGTLALRGSFSDAGLRLDPLELRSGRSWLRLAGSVQPQPSLSGQWRIDAADLQQLVGLPSNLLATPVQGELQLKGPWVRPGLALRASQVANPLLGPWQAELSWADQRLRLDRFASEHLRASGSLPVAFQPGRGLVSGGLVLDLALRRYPLERLDPLVGTQLQGWLDATGSVRGPLVQLQPDFNLLVDQPAAGPLALAERWRGEWFGAVGGGGRLAMRAEQPSVAGQLEMRLDQRWQPVAASLQRAGGRLQLSGTPRTYRWQAERFPLAGLQLALGPRGQRQPLQGRLSGAGHLDLQPLAFAGRVQLERPVLLGVWGRQATIEGRYSARRYQLNGVLETPLQGRIDLAWSGRWRGPFQSRIQFEQLGPTVLTQLAQAWPLWLGEQASAPGQAGQLGDFWINRFGASVDRQLAALEAAQQRLAAVNADQARLSPWQRLAAVGLRADGELRLTGPRLPQARAELAATLQLWRSRTDSALPLGDGPVRLRFSGPLLAGSGAFELDGLPLALLGLLTPIPQELRGAVQARGRYRLGNGLPELSLVVALVEARFGDTALLLERGQLELQQERLQLDLSLRAAGAASSLDLAGVVPMDPADPGLELRLSSRDDGLRFLSRLAEPALQWHKGSGDLQLLVRGSLNQPLANGFLRLRDSELSFIGQSVRELEGVVLFDFEELLLQDLSARVGEQGRIRGEGRLRLFTPLPVQSADAPELRLNLEAVPFRLPRIRAVADGALLVRGTLLSMNVGGELAVGRGNVNVQPGRLDAGADAPAAVSVPQLVESRWDFQAPLVLLGSEVESGASEALRAAVPRFRPLGFDDLRLRLGPDLTVGVPNLASFQASGLLRINGRLDPSLQARGVVRLLRGRLNLFTTTFSLDPEAPNVAVFTPALGLVPYLDIALRTRISDSLNVGGGIGAGGSLSLAELERVETNSLNQLNLVRVFLSVSGPADRLAENLSLRSSPPLPQDRLLALIGGNSLAGLGGSGAGTALATVLGQSLLSPVLGTLSDVFGERVSLALYPAYVNQAVSDSSERRSGRVPPQLVLGAEIGLDVTERFNASVLAAPNRSDVPPQLNLTYKASDVLNLQGSIDSLGAWQTQLQIFFRF